MGLIWRINKIGAFLIFDVSFEKEKDRKRFEEKYKIKKKDILVGEKSNSKGFTAWTYMRNPYLDVIYFMGFMGYEDPKEILKECKKEKINIKFLAWIPINDKDTIWEKLRGRWDNGMNKSREMCDKCLWETKNLKCKDKYCLVNQLLEGKK